MSCCLFGESNASKASEKYRADYEEPLILRNKESEALKILEGIKIVSPLDIERFEHLQSQAISYHVYCRKKEYIYDYFYHMNGCIIYNNRKRPDLHILKEVIMLAIPKECEKELSNFIYNFFHHNNERNLRAILKLTSEIVIHHIYNYCKSVTDGTSDIMGPDRGKQSKNIPYSTDIMLWR